MSPSIVLMKNIAFTTVQTQSTFKIYIIKIQIWEVHDNRIWSFCSSAKMILQGVLFPEQWYICIYIYVCIAKFSFSIWELSKMCSTLKVLSKTYWFYISFI